MFRQQAFLDPDGPHRKSFTLPPELDMGTVKLEDLHFDVAREASRLRTAEAMRAPRP